MGRLNHLNLAVADLERSRRFYERWFGFDAGPTEWLGDALFLRDVDGFDLALTPVGDETVVVVGSFHLGFQLGERGEVQALLDGIQSAGVPVAAIDDEPGFFSFKCRDPDGYLVEVAWSEPGT